MREIKFRTWDNKQMFRDPSECCGISGKINDEFSEIGGRIFMQYTGLKDKNGKEIYEGDVVRFKRNIGLGDSLPITKGKVSYSPDYAQFEFAGYAIEPTIKRTIEVIGNIYESKHLLDNEIEVEEIPQMKGTLEALDNLSPSRV